MNITIDKLTKKYDGRHVLDDFSMTFPAGSVTTLMGESGCGKTTLANLMLGLSKPDSGIIKGIDGKKLSAVFQEDRLCEQLSAVENIRLVLSKHTEKEEVIAQLAAIGIDRAHALKPVSQLSGGQKRRVAILRAMMADSDFICLDEPFKGLDKDTKENTMNYVKKAIRGKTVLLITHDSKEAEFFGGDLIELLPEAARAKKH